MKSLLLTSIHLYPYEGYPALNESYNAFGKEYLAPADGTVVRVENDVQDNEPVGEMNEEEPYSNYVILDHGNEEISQLAHFKYQSIEMKEGDEVKEGDLLGLVGNSGNSSEPHIHFHVPDFSDLSESKSIRINFNRDEEFIQGDFVE
ncbi:M23 family metallopeptidase [Salipaludibacillus sp. HK11]|uniref:M23 family metallopeptidase n=1 Tax=Salipaludibacillus sp. HK11 TaxID=3394320 RepID=UPI0039FC6CF0